MLCFYVNTHGSLQLGGVTGFIYLFYLGAEEVIQITIFNF